MDNREFIQHCIVPVTVFPNKRKDQRVLKKLNKIGVDDFYLLPIN